MMAYLRSSSENFWNISSSLVSAPAEQMLALFPWRPKIQINLDRGPYVVRTANTVIDLLQCFRLRYQCFFGGSSKGAFIPLDYDKYDLYYDHIIIEDKASKKIIGTYRVHSSEEAHDFYGSNEFELDEFLKLPGKKLELGRASIHQDYRNGATIDALWKGLAKYIQVAGADYLFGCSSIMGFGKMRMSYLNTCFHQQEFYDHNLKLSPKNKYVCELEHFDLSEAEVREVLKRDIPSLLRSYLTAGAKIAGHPALDAEFNCYDIFTYLEVAKVSPVFKKRYFNWGDHNETR